MQDDSLGETTRTLRALSDRYSGAYLMRDTKYLDDILADDWFLITARCGGKTFKKDQLDEVSDGSLRVHSIEDSDVEVHVFGEAALVIGQRESKVTYKGRDVGDTTRFSQFYARRDGRWQCIYTQVTSIRPDPDGMHGRH